MKFKEALKAAGLANPGRTTWCGIAEDGMPVFTVWSQEVRRVHGRYFAWWDHTGKRDANGEHSPSRSARARTFIELAVRNLGSPCRAVILHPRVTERGIDGVATADYPHPALARVVFRFADVDALQFVAELLPPA